MIRLKNSEGRISLEAGDEVCSTLLPPQTLGAICLSREHRMTATIRRRQVWVPLALVLALAGPALAETTNCTAITSLPYTIALPGPYCLIGDLSTSISTGSAITINSNSVTLDLNGYKLGGTAGTSTAAVGVAATDRKYVTVKNGVIKGFDRAVDLFGSSSSANLIEDIVAERNYGVSLIAYGSGSVVRRNRVVNAGGRSGNVNAHGIFVNGTGVVRDNDVMTVVGAGSGSGIGLVAQGIYLVLDNRFSDLDVAMSISGDSKYRNNTTTAVVTLHSGSGTDGGGNN